MANCSQQLLLSRSWGLPWSRWFGASVSPASHLWGRSKISFKNVWTMLKGLFKNFQQSGSFKICWPNPQEWPLWFCLQWGSYPRWIIPHFFLKIKDGKELGCIKWIGTITKLPRPSTPQTCQAHSSLSVFALRNPPPPNLPPTSPDPARLTPSVTSVLLQCPILKSVFPTSPAKVCCPHPSMSFSLKLPYSFLHSSDTINSSSNSYYWGVSTTGQAASSKLYMFWRFGASH